MYDYTQAIDLVLAMMRSASTTKIRPVDWWTRARSALETGASASDSFPSLVSVMGRKLQIDALSQESSEIVARIETQVIEFEEFRRTCEQRALYITAMAQAKRDEQRRTS